MIIIVSTAYDKGVINVILGLSVSKDYNQAKREWDFTGTVIDYGPLKDQKPVAKCNLCGHPIRYGYILQNKQNNKKIEVGSECVGNFMNISDSLITKMDKAKKSIKKEKEKNAYAAYQAAASDIARLGIIVKRSGNAVDSDKIDRMLYNKDVFYTAIKKGIALRLAKKYGYKVNVSKIRLFMRTYTR